MWLDMNEAFMGRGDNAITGMNDTISAHTDSLNDGNGNSNTGAIGATGIGTSFDIGIGGDVQRMSIMEMIVTRATGASNESAIYTYLSNKLPQ